MCLWQVADNPADGFELLRPRALDEHVHGCGLELDDAYLYLSCDVRNERGFLGEWIAIGETVRYSLDAFINGSGSLKFADAEVVARAGGGTKTAVEAGYLWTIDSRGSMALALDTNSSFTPLSGKGYGRSSAVLAGADAQRALVAGAASVGVVESLPGQRPGIRFGSSRLHYPLYGALRTDMRVLRDGPRFANVNSLLASHPYANTEEVIITLSPSGAIQLHTRERATGVASAAWPDRHDQ